ncbi:unnamed protein product [Prunus armeniaca]
MRTCLCCFGGRWSPPPSFLGLSASRSALSCLAGQDPRVLIRRLPRAFILLQERPLDRFPRLGRDALIAISEQDSVWSCLAHREELRLFAFLQYLGGAFPRHCLIAVDLGDIAPRDWDCVNPYDLLGRLLGGVSIFSPLDGLLPDEFHAVTFSHEFFKGFVGLLAQVVQVVRVLLDCSVRGVFFGEDVRQLLEAADRPGWQVWNQSWAAPRKVALGIRIPLKCVNEGVENCFEGAACSISAVKGVEFAWSISLRSTSSKFLPVFKSRSRSFTSFSMSYTHIVGRSRWRR